MKLTKILKNILLEIKPRADGPIKIIPWDGNSGTIVVPGVGDISYEITNFRKHQVEIKPADSDYFMAKYGDDVGEDEEWYPVEESEIECKKLLKGALILLKNLGAEIEEDSYQVSFITLSPDKFEELMPKDPFPTDKGNGVYEWRGHTLTIKKTTEVMQPCPNPAFEQLHMVWQIVNENGEVVKDNIVQNISEDYIKNFKEKHGPDGVDGWAEQGWPFHLIAVFKKTYGLS